MIGLLQDVLPMTPAGRRAAWVVERLLDVAMGADPPTADEIAEQYAPSWLAEVPTGPAFFSAIAPIVSSAVAATAEPSRANEVRWVIDLGDGTFRRFRCTVEDRVPHRVDLQLFSPAVDPVRAVHRVMPRDERIVHVRDYGGDGPLLLLWHGSGCDATVWEGVIPHLASFHVVAQDLPGHGRSPIRRLSAADTVADADALLDELGVDDPILVGHSLGGWIAMHYAASRGRCHRLVCLDGPTSLDYGAMGLTPSQPGFIDDPPDIGRDLRALHCPTLVSLCAGTSPAEAEWMVRFRRPLSAHISANPGPVRLEWQPTGHMMVLSHPEQTADLIARFACE